MSHPIFHADDRGDQLTVFVQEDRPAFVVYLTGAGGETIAVELCFDQARGLRDALNDYLEVPL